jgi:hypothetical protein
MSAPVGTVFDPASIEANRNGQLTAAQRAGENRRERNWRGNALYFAGVAAVIGVLVVTSSGGQDPQIERYAIGAVAFVIAAVLLVLRFMPNSNPLARDLRDGRVVAVDGPFGKTTSSGTQLTSYYFELGDRRYEVAQDTYRAAPNAGMMRLYVLPHSHRVVNFERLSDPPVPAGALTARSVMGAIASELTGVNQAQRLQTMAVMTALGHSLESSPTPPPPDQRDPRPLAQAILGSWKWAAVHVTFSDDGTASVTMPGGGSMSGRWSVSGERLQVTGAGQDITGEAWVAGDTLTVVQDGQVMALHRAG